MKYIIFDAGPLISLAMNGLLPVIAELKKVFKGEFILTPQVKREVIDRPMKVKKFKLEAMKIKYLLDNGILKMSHSIVSSHKLEKETKRIMKIVNGTLRVEKTGEKINIIHEGEASCLAFAKICKGDNVIVLDERSTRLITESPEKLKKLMESKLKTKIVEEFGLIEELKGFKFIRSAELLFIAYKKNILPANGDKELLDAMLYAVKFKGAAISSAEIEEMKRLV
ncbi:MAG: hypothetical protein ABIF88_03420 [archaeon]